MYIPIDHYDQFDNMRNFSRESVSDILIDAAKGFHESEDLEEMLLTALTDPNRTPHGPSEIVDIMTVQLSHRDTLGVAGIILKGRSFQNVKPKDVSHQIFRLRQVTDLKFAIFGHVGNVLDGVREEFIRTAEDLGVDYTFVDANDFARLSIVQAILCPRDAKRLIRGHCSCGYRAYGDRLNIFQKEAIRRLRAEHRLNKKAGVVVMPTGSGKTRVAVLDASYAEAERILYVAHTHEILDGAEREFGHIFGIDKVYRELENDVSSLPVPSVHLITIQTLVRQLSKLKNHQFEYIVIDEFHHAAASSYRKLISKLKPRFLLGLTATPFRSDRQDVIELCHDNVVVNFEMRAGIEQDILAPFHYYGCIDDVNYSGLRKHANGYYVDDLNRALIIPERDAAIIEKWSELAGDLSTLAFCCSQTHAIRMAESFRDHAISADVYLGTTLPEIRSELITKLQYGEIKVLCVVDVLNEGIDLPFVECLLFLRPTDSKRIFLQQLGRGLRKSPGKDRVIVLDFIGNFYNAYLIPEYLGLYPEDHPHISGSGQIRFAKDILNLPLGCEVHFDSRVIDIFESQIHDPSRANRHNIAQILVYTYFRTTKRLGHRPTRKELDRNQILHSGLYDLVFGSWKSFENFIAGEKLSDWISN